MRLKNGKGENMRLIDADVLKQHIDKLPALPDGNFAGNHSALKALINMQPTIEPEQRWIPCSERLPEEYGEYRITWVTSYAPSKRIIGDSEYEVTSVWDEERKDFKGEWLLDEYIKHYPDVKVIAWKPLEEPYQAERRTDE